MRNRLFLVILFIGIVFNSYSSHILGGEITYKYIDNQGPAGNPFRYEITISVYNNRDGQVPNGEEDGFGYAIYEAQTGNFIEYRNPTPNYIFLNPQVPPGCNVPGVTNFRITLNEFVDTVNLPFSARGFDVIWERGNRLNGINNLLNSGDEGSTFHAFIPASIYQNSSPQFTDRPIPAMCISDTTGFVNNAFDPDGDQLLYRFGTGYGMNFWGGGQFAPFNTPESPQIYNNYNYPPPVLPYASGFSGTAPFGPNGYAFINSSTGLSRYYSPNAGNYVVNVYIDEYRTIGGVPTLISTTRREIQLFISDQCQPNQNPVITSTVFNNNPFINIFEGDSVEFIINSTDPDLDNVTLDVTGAILDSNSGYTGPLATFDVNPNGDQGTFKWKTECNMAGSYQLSFSSEDNGCPPKTLNNIYTINVLPFQASSIQGPDTVCFLDDSSLFTTSGPNSSTYTWKTLNGNISGYNNDSTQIGIAWGIPGNGRIDIVETNFAGCKDSTFKIVTVNNAEFINADRDTTICSGDSVPVNASGAGLFSWYPAQFTVDSNSASTLVFPDSTTEFIVTSRSNLCFKPDTVTIEVNHFESQIPDDTTCMRDTLQIGEPAITGYQYNWITATGLDDTTIAQPNLVLDSAGVFTYLVSVVDSNQCAGIDSVDILINQAPDSVEIFGGISICPDAPGISYLTEDTSLIAFSWSVDGGTLVSGQGTDSITVDWAGANPNASINLVPTNDLGCVGDTSKLPIVINPILQIQLPDGPDTLCFFDRDSLDYSIPLVNGSNYTWTVSVGGNINEGQNTEEINVTWSGDTIAYLFVEDSVRTISSVCLGKSDTLFVQINPSPDTTLSLVGNFDLCSFSDSIGYSISGLDSSSFVWSLDTGGTIINGQGTDNVVINWDSTGIYPISVIETTKDGCLGRIIDTSITVRSIPSTSYDFGTVQSKVCLDLDNVFYSVAGFANSTYKWGIAGGDSIESDSSSVYVNWDETFTKELYAIETSEYNCIGDTLFIDIEFDPSNITLVAVSDNFDDETLIDLTWNKIYREGDTLTEDLVLYRREISPSITAWDSITTISKLDDVYSDGPLETNATNYEYYLATSNICLDTITTLNHQNILINGSADEASSTTTLSWNQYEDWSKFDGVREYNIYRNLDENGYELIETTSNIDSVIELTNGGDGFNHCFRIEAIQELDDEVTSWSNEVCVEYQHDILVYNAMTPNGDLQNDNFHIKNIWLYPENDIQIFNRWGNLVYQKNGYNNTWDGGNLPDGTYYYIVKVSHKGTQLPVVKGDLLLQR